MKLLHTSDLHIGKRVNEFSMLEDQKYILDKILNIAREEQADGIILAGDIYDKPIPPAEAVQVFDRFLTGLADLKIPVFVISGNHDSAERLSFGARLMDSRGVHVSSVYEGNPVKVTLRDDYGEADIHLLPFLRPSSVRHALDCEVTGYQEALGEALAHMEIDKNKRNVLVAHQFVTGASRCESEEISVGGLDNVDAALFDAFDYVALGHIHSPQHVGREAVRYCGTPLKYSFSEAGQEKSVTVAELLEKGQVSIRTVPLTPLRDMRKIRGTYMELTSLSFYEHTNTEDYIHATLTDEEDIVDGMARLRVIYPNLMTLEYDNRRTREHRQVEGPEEMEQKSELELFRDFYQLQNNQPMSPAQEEFAGKLIRKIQDTL